MINNIVHVTLKTSTNANTINYYDYTNTYT